MTLDQANVNSKIKPITVEVRYQAKTGTFVLCELQIYHAWPRARARAYPRRTLLLLTDI